MRNENGIRELSAEKEVGRERHASEVTMRVREWAMREGDEVKGSDDGGKKGDDWW